GWLAKRYDLLQNPGFEDAMKEGGNTVRFDRGIYFYWFAALAHGLELADVREVATDRGPRRWANDIIAALSPLQAKDGTFKNSQYPIMSEDDESIATTMCLLAAESALRDLAKK